MEEKCVNWSVCISWLFILNELSKSRSSLSQKFIKIAALKYFAKFTGKKLCQNFFFDKVPGASGVQHFLKRDPDTGVFL